MTVNTCRNSVDISQWLTGTSFVHAEENLKKKQKINTVTCTLSIWKQIFKEKINILKNFQLNLFMFEHITRTLDTDRKSIPEQINVLRFFKVFIYTRKLKFRNLSNNKFFFRKRIVCQSLNDYNCCEISLNSQHPKHFL